jgi:hypothetical protein
MLNIILVSLGIVLMFYSIFLSRNLISVIKESSLRRTWNFSFALIVFFLIGYIVYFYIKLNPALHNLIFSEMLISSILFFGAVFVVVILIANSKVVKKLNNDAELLEVKNKNLKNRTVGTERANSELKKAQDDLERKNQELESTLDDLYTLRIKMENDLSSGKTRSENRKIKKRLDALKKRK